MNVIGGIKKCYLGLQQYDELILFLEDARAGNPQNVNIPSDIAEVYYLKNERDKAADIWQAHIARYRKNIGVYRIVASSMISLRMFDDAIKVYQQAMQEIDSQYNLYVDIANLYKIQLKYAEATGQLLFYYKYNPKQFNFVQNQILGMADEQDQRVSIIMAIRSFLNDHPEQKQVNEILASQYILNKEFEKAFEIYKDLEDERSNGQFLFKFANQANSNDALEYALAAYKLLQSNYPGSSYAANISMNIAHSHMRIAYKLQAGKNQAAAGKEMQTALAMFDSLTKNAANYYQRIESHNQMADIYAQFYFDLDRAIYHYQKYVSMQKDIRQRDAIMIKLGDVFLTKNQLQEADKTYALVQGLEYRSTAKFKRIEILYFRGLFDKAQKQYQQLKAEISPEHHLFNDILIRTQMLTFFSSDTSALAEFSRAELLIFQQKVSEAAEILTKLARSGRQISPRAGLNAGQIFFDLAEFDTARNILQFVREQYPNDIHIDELIYQQARIEEAAANHRAALDFYTEILTGHQTSLHLSEARKQARVMTELLNGENN